MESTQDCRSSTLKKKPSTSTNNIMVLDGCFRSQLILLDEIYTNSPFQYGINIDSPSIAQNVHLDFLSAGANMIRTNTLEASAPYLRYAMEYGDDDINNFFVQSVKNARKAIAYYMANEKKPLEVYNSLKIVGSCSSATSCHSVSQIESWNRIPGITISQVEKTREEYKEYHKLRAKLLRDAGVDMLGFESITVAEEAYAILDVMRELQYPKAWISFKPATIHKLRDGNDLKKIATECYTRLQPQIYAVGINCVDPINVKSILSSINNKNNAGSMIPLVVCPNSGIPWASNPFWQPMHFVSKYPVYDWLSMNIKCLGGCCYVLRQNIQLIRNVLNTHNKPSQFQS